MADDIEEIRNDIDTALGSIVNAVQDLKNIGKEQEPQYRGEIKPIEKQEVEKNNPTGIIIPEKSGFTR